MKVIRGILVGFLLDDAAKVMSQLSNSLDKLELSLGNDDELVAAQLNWRGIYGEHRNRLFHLGVMLDYIQQLMKPNPTETPTPAAWSSTELRRVQSAPAKSSSSSSSSEKVRHAAMSEHGTPGTPHPIPRPEKSIDKNIEHVMATRASLSKRIDSTYQAVISTLSILENHRAAADAEAVNRLTNLAFFFFPLNLVSVILTMPLKEFQESRDLRVWLWVTVSLSVMALCYSVIYMKELRRLLRRTWRYLTNLDNRAKLKDFLVNLMTVAVIVFVFLLFSGIIALGSVGVWKIIKTDVSGSAKGGLSFLVVLVTLLVLFCGCACVSVD